MHEEVRASIPRRLFITVFSGEYLSLSGRGQCKGKNGTDGPSSCNVSSGWCTSADEQRSGLGRETPTEMKR